MKKIVIMGFVAIFVIASAVISFAQESGKTDKPLMGKGMMRGQDMWGRGMKDISSLCGMMRGNGGMVATQDGGVIVMMGNKLYKYDKNLNLVKETEIKIDMEGMQKMMTEMKEKSPLCHEMQERCEMLGQGKEEKEQKESVKSTKP